MKSPAEWLKTGEILLLSRQKAENGNLEMAIQLLQTARFQAETAIKQADLEAHAWKHRVIGYRKTEE